MQETSPKNFALIGCGFVAPRHLKAIQQTHNNLLCFVDPNDSVGVIDHYFPKAHFFTEFERFERHINKLKQSKSGHKIDFISICSPNHQHDAHIRFALQNNADVICEKPVVLNPWNLDSLCKTEEETGKKVNCILQLRLVQAVQKLKSKIENSQTNTKHQVELTYITRRGQWYDHSWKGDVNKSGGICTNIGIHFFDLLQWLFGSFEKSTLFLSEPRRAAGFIELKNADVKWFLSIDESDLPTETKQNNQSTFRSLKIDDIQLDLSAGFEDLHTKSYELILKNQGFNLDAARPSLEFVYALRHQTLSNPTKECAHPFLQI